MSVIIFQWYYYKAHIENYEKLPLRSALYPVRYTIHHMFHRSHSTVTNALSRPAVELGCLEATSRLQDATPT
jgi:hypothetical protein